MILFPAIDLKDGQCVRLKLGEMDSATVYNADPAAQAKAFEDQGFEWLHVVDLNGAFEGQSVNGAAVEAILKATRNPVQLGGGIRTLAHIEAWLDKGLARVILGTIAVRDPDLVREACRRFPASVAVGIDAKGGKVAVEGWAEASELGVIELAKSVRGRRRCRDHLHRHRPRWCPDRHQLGIDHRTGRRGLDPGDRLRRPRLDRRHRAHDHARCRKS
jgi:phosphoribosylformimino-5-aminoimidazole carboxamide ribotide isomerase